MGVAEFLTILFVALKLTAVIDWSWWLVLLPSIISFSIYAVFLLIWLTGFGFMIKEMFKGDK